ncbi:arginine transporter [Yoonia sediminilitoris]|uniref:Arginine transporter n=1 Tax=Yoonia sediminilitoris TaxID=1286148 RepID=A0A2T6K7T9_9RHOB|nr:arginine transporter [Yoonia sediminilitoris]PUB10733.1 hypothetical protein C8N45_11778 [Yoonia sediminilitoris]RCW90485.1 hypothetical protein DFP92_11778 [Yoonia sediminilitoris]
MRSFKFLGALFVLAACGGGPNVSGSVSDACLAVNRKAATPALCSCVQQVANNTLSKRDQSRAASFFFEPQLAQDTRQSDNSRDEAFWQRYKRFSTTAASQCRALT